MKKHLFFVLSLSFALTACNNVSTSDLTTELQQPQVSQIQSAKTVKLNLNKSDSNAKVSKSVSTLKDKKSRGETKKVEKLEIAFIAPSAKNDLDQKAASAIARITLTSMGSAQSFESGYKIALPALEKMAAENVYIAKIALAMTKAGMYWETDYKIAAAALNNVSSETPTSVNATCNMILSLMGNTKSFEEGSKIAYAALDIIGQTNNEDVRFVVNTAVTSAKQAMYWEDVYKTLNNTFTELKNF